MPRKILCFLCGLLITSHSLWAAPLPDISADGAILIESQTNTILYAKNHNIKFYPASTTKVLTALAIAQDLPMDQIIYKSQESVNNVPSDSSQIGLNVGDHYTVYDGLHAVLMASDNFVCYDLAIADLGSMEVFANRMNALAGLAGATRTNFVNSHGYHDPMHYTTPYSLGKLTQLAFDNPIVAQIAGTYKYDFKVLNSNKTIPITHTAAILNPSSTYYNPYVVAAKTGYHTPAGRTLVAKADYGDIEFIAVVMRTDAPLQFQDINTLFEYGSQNFSVERIEETHELFVVNETYSDWAKPYVQHALDKKWITHTGRNYTTPITIREFSTLLRSSATCQYNNVPQELIRYSGNSIYRENLSITRSEAAQIIYKYLAELDLIPISKGLSISDIDDLSPLAQKSINFVVQANIMPLKEGTTFSPHDTVPYEDGLYIITQLDDIIDRYHTYNLPGDNFLCGAWGH